MSVGVYSESPHGQAETEWCSEAEREILAKRSTDFEPNRELIAAWAVAAALVIGLVALSM
jgi:hypothetical protein